MKKIFLVFLSCVSLLANAKEWRSEPVFEENAGQIKNESAHVVSSADHAQFILRAGKLDYYFTRSYYVVVQYGDDHRANATRIDLPSSETIGGVIPEGEGISPGVKRYITSSLNGIVQTYDKIIYRNIIDGGDIEFSLENGFLVKKLIMHKKHVLFELSFNAAGSEIQPVESDSQCGYVFRNPCGEFREVLSTNHPHFNISDVRSQLEWSMDPVQPEYFFSEDNDNPQTVSTITWLTYLGGNSSDELFGLAVTPDGGAVVTGRTSSPDFPVTVGSYQDTINLSYDAVVSRFDSIGNCLWSTYYGGNDFDGAYNVIRMDTLYVVCGSSNSTTLPMVNSFQSNNAGSYDGFLAVFSDSGMLIRSTYFGGTGGDQFFALALDTSRRIVVAGSSSSTNFPFTSGNFQPSLAGAIDATLAVFDQQLNPVWATYYGGPSSEDIHSICTSPNGEIIFAGGTYSNTFPITADAYQNGMFSMPDCYLVKFGMDGSRHYATFFGGTGTEDCNAVIADSTGAVYVTGFTYSVDFPIMGNTFQSIHASQSDVFVAKFDPAGQMEWSTFLGGTGVENGLALDRKGKYIFISGNTESPNFPVTANAIQNTYAATSDGFVVKMDTAGTMVSGTFMGGNGVDALYAVGVTNDTSIISCGTTYSTNLAVTPGAYQSTNMTQGDGYVVKFGMSEQNVGNAENDSNQSRSDLVLYPVPTNGILHIGPEQKNIVFIDVYDMSGKVVKTIQGNFSSGTIDVSELAPGNYSLAMHYTGGMILGFPFIKN